MLHISTSFSGYVEIVLIVAEFSYTVSVPRVASSVGPPRRAIHAMQESSILASTYVTFSEQHMLAISKIILHILY